MPRRSFIRLLTVAAFLAAAPAFTGSSASEPEAGATARTVAVRLSEYRVSPSTRRTRSRRVTFRVRNAGVIAHEFVVIRTRRRASRLPKRGMRASERGRVGKIRAFGPGRTRTLALRLRRGHYALICNLPAHYRLGMRRDFTVR